MIPGKKYTPEDFLRIAWRRQWLLVLPLIATIVGGLLYAYSLPEQWMSAALIQVVPQQVPQEYVRSSVTMRIEDRLDSIKQLILSRTKLEAIIQEFNLYPDERRGGLMEEVVDRMRNSDISMAVAKGDAFRISFVSSDPKQAQRVTERLTSLFIAENLRDREVVAERSSQFLESQLNEVRTLMENTEKRLAAYRQKFSGQLPDQASTNLQALTNLQMQIAQVTDALNRDRDNRLFIQRQLADLNDSASSSSGSAPSTPAIPGSDPTAAVGSAGSAADKLEAARIELRRMELRFTPEHPDVIRMKRIISDLERKVEQEALAQPVSASPSTPRISPADTARLNRAKELQTQLASLDRAIAAKQADIEKLRNNAAGYQGRLEAGPTRESELTALTRDYSTYSDQYRSLLAKNQEAKMSASLERRQGGEQFRLLDPARIPERPFSPNRTRILAMALVMGLALGGGLIALLEYRDRSLRTDEDVMLVLALPVLAVIPQMSSSSERQALRRRKLMMSAAGAFGVICVAAVFVWKFVQWREYLPW
jgi:polysaccharide chain length determinant protein (PEP-CTERM system associated)